VIGACRRRRRRRTISGRARSRAIDAAAAAMSSYGMLDRSSSVAGGGWVALAIAVVAPWGDRGGA
jgi:hypothetical protein